MAKHNVFIGKRLKRIVAPVPALISVLVLAACGGGGAPTTTSGLKNRAFISNVFSGNLQIVDTQNDTTAYTQETTNSAGQVVQGQPVTISVSTSVTFEVLSPDRSTTLVYDPSTDDLFEVTNSSETESGEIPLGQSAGMALYSTDGTEVFAPEPNAPVSGSRNGVLAEWNVSSKSNTANYDIPAVRYIAVSPNGQYLLAFSDNSDSVTLLNLTASTVTPVTIPGFAAPINAFFSGDGNTAYVLNCGPECGSSNPASVMQFDIPSQTITATVPVGGASVGLLNGSTLYVAGSPVPPGTSSTYDAVNVGNMTRITANSVAIGDGFHTTMALAQNNQLYIGANTCSNTVTGCLSVVNVSTNTASAPLPPYGAITSLLAISGRNTVYAIEGGLVHIYDTSTNTLQPAQITFSGALYGIVQVDQ